MPTMLTPLLMASLAVQAQADKPNFCIFFVDDMGIDQIEVPANQREYGYTGNKGTIKTPAIRLLAEEGMVFQTWYSGFHVCSPSRAAMMTGRLPVRSGVGGNPQQGNPPGPSQGVNLVFSAEAIGGLPTNETTFAEALKPLGYATMMIGKWHLGVRDIYLPASRGFDEYLGIPFSQDMGLSFWSNHGYKNVAPYFPAPLPIIHNFTVIEQPASLFTIAERYAGSAVDFIKTSVAAKKPWVLYFPFNHIHGPESCGARFVGASARGTVGDATEETDWMIGQTMDVIRELAPDNTLVFFTSDNGAPTRPDGNLPLKGFKTMIWEGGFREPGIAWWPGKIAAGSSSKALVATYDIFPTILNLAGAKLPPVVLDGIDISDVLFGKSDKAHDCIFYYKYPNACDGDKPSNLAAVRCGDYKVFYWLEGNVTPPTGKPVIYNLVTDISESTPLPYGTDEYFAAKNASDAARAAHLATVEIVPNQNARGNDPANVICGAPNSTLKYPQFPNCTLTPQNWDIPVCGDTKKFCNMSANGTCPKDCPYSGWTPHPTPPPSPPPSPLPPYPVSTGYVGCYMDHQVVNGVNQTCDLPDIIHGHCSNKRHNDNKAWEANPSVALCNRLCSQIYPNDSLFGVQNGGSGCFCGTKAGSEGVAPAGGCNMTCHADNLSCGGPNINSVYKIIKS